MKDRCAPAKNLKVASDNGMSARENSSVNFSYPSEVEFSIRIFFKELLIMVLTLFLGPVGILLVIAFVGIDGAYNRSFLGPRAMLPLIQWTVTATCIFLLPSVRSDIQKLIGWTFILLLGRALMIATKYAMMSEKFYILTTTHTRKNFSTLEAQQVTASWMNPSSDVLRQELAVAMKRNNVSHTSILMDLHEVPSSVDQQQEQQKHLDGYKCAFEWLERAGKRFEPSWKSAAMVGMFMAVSPILCYYYSAEQKEQSSYDTKEWIAIACTVFNTAMTEAPHFIFMFIAIADVKKRLYLMQHCSMLIAPGHSYLRQEVVMRKNDCLDMPLLKRNATTIHSWVNLRRILTDFGKDFYARLSAYYSISVLLVVFVAVSLFLQVLINGEIGVTIYTVPMLIISLTTIVATFKLIYLGMRLNREHFVQSDVLLQYTRQIEQDLFSKNDNECDYQKKLQKLNVTAMALRSSREQLHIDTQLRPYRVLGMPANTLIAKVMVSMVVSYILILLRIAK